MKNVNLEKKIPRIEQPDGMVQSYDREEKIMISSFSTKLDKENFSIIDEDIFLGAAIEGIKR